MDIRLSSAYSRENNRNLLHGTVLHLIQIIIAVTTSLESDRCLPWQISEFHRTLNLWCVVVCDLFHDTEYPVFPCRQIHGTFKTLGLISRLTELLMEGTQYQLMPMVAEGKYTWGVKRKHPHWKQRLHQNIRILQLNESRNNQFPLAWSEMLGVHLHYDFLKLPCTLFSINILMQLIPRKMYFVLNAIT